MRNKYFNACLTQYNSDRPLEETHSHVSPIILPLRTKDRGMAADRSRTATSTTATRQPQQLP